MNGLGTPYPQELTGVVPKDFSRLGVMPTDRVLLGEGVATFS